MRKVRTVLLRRRGSYWRVDLALRRPPRRVRLRPLVAPRREEQAAPLATRLASRRARTVVTNRVLARSRVLQLVQTIAPTTFRSESFVSLTQTLAGSSPPTPANDSPRARATAAPTRAVERAHRVAQIVRERLTRHLRTETIVVAPAAATAVDAPQPARLVGPPPLVLRAIPAAAPARAADAPPVLAAHELERTEAWNATQPPQPPSLPDVDLLATHVLDRIERRAIAQRERLGRI